ncbi:hypothetical protein BC938DRAFT_484155 [Jimgerdemannia flammicorona]|uniref:A to I editase domain-containing protein n=1 Tax=Jimgerdemannia flammicorona TaxID=994334 RepID=A0A433QVC1_9FUNG|nr:hypothetical protein BC938DRAFT_484155 [Jimgerdemannia flammicorona]
MCEDEVKVEAWALSTISKICLFQRFVEVLKLCPEETLPPSLVPLVQSPLTVTYRAAKHTARGYQAAKHRLLEQRFSGWVLSPDELEIFDVEGTTVKMGGGGEELGGR